MLDTAFLERMKLLLGDGFEDFSAALEKSAERSFRINPIKLQGEEFTPPSGLVLKEIPYASRAYTVLSGGEGLGNTPQHHAGQIYIQDGGAMSAICALPKLPDGARVADLCAAPGGKSSQLAALIGEEGALLSNEIVHKRAVILVENLTRMGVRNALVTSADTARLAELYPGFFDLVTVDAPCSGEGMFRKGEVAISEWSEENVGLCAERQTEILKNASKMLKSGGYLLYSTCTYSLEENEMQIDNFLKENPDFSLEEIKNEELIRSTSDGIQLEGAYCNTLKYCRRFYPHLASGEGQFFALLRNNAEPRGEKITKDKATSPSKEEERIAREFLKENLKSVPKGRILKRGANLEIVAHDIPIDPSVTVTGGVTIGEIRGKILFPHHQLFSAYGSDFIRQEELTDEASASRYLRGEEIDQHSLGSGYIAVSFGKCTLGGGKASNGKIKNHYPKFLRIKG